MTIKKPGIKEIRQSIESDLKSGDIRRQFEGLLGLGVVGSMGAIGLVVVIGLADYALDIYRNGFPEVDQRTKQYFAEAKKEYETERRKPARISVYDDRTEVSYVNRDVPYAGEVLVDRGNDGSVNEVVIYPPPFRGVGRMYRESTESDQVKYMEAIKRNEIRRK